MTERRLSVGNLPADLTTFVGRAEELSQVRRLLSQSRLVTLTGVGGVGKSRLALRAAHQMSRVFADGTWLVELSALHDEALLAQAVGHALGLSDRAAGDPVEGLSAALARRSLLLVMDNCEHLVPSCQLLLSALLRAAPGLRVLATSREVLRIPGEQVYEVAPLDVPRTNGSKDPRSIAGYPGVALFTKRAEEVRPVFALTEENACAVAAVCRLSEGLPLFLELAAAQLRGWSVQQLAHRLEDRFELHSKQVSPAVARHRSLRAAVEWSFMLCSDAERLVWERASVFAGRFDLDAAEGVCAGETLPVPEVLDALAGLIDKSVLVCEDGEGNRRYWMLDTLRLYGLERLRSTETGDAAELALRRRHRDYYLALAEQFNADWFGPRQAEWSRRMRAELPEFRAALSFSLATPAEVPTAVRLAGALNNLWNNCGVAREGSLWLERALAADPSPTKDRVRALVAYTQTLTLRSLHAECTQPARECLELARQLDDPHLLADAVSARGLNLLHTGDLPEALRLLDEGIERAAALPDAPRALALAAVCRAGAAFVAGEPEHAEAMAERARDVCETHGDRCWLNYALSVLMLAAFVQGNAARAAALGREILPGCAALGDTNGLTLALEFLAWTAGGDGDHRRAARLLGAADHQAWLNGGNPTASGLFGPAHERCEADARAALGDAPFDVVFRRGEAFTLDEVIAYAQGDAPAPEPRPAQAAPPSEAIPRLTKRELEIARLIAKGMTNKHIAQQLVISTRTAEGHVEHILSKLGFTTRTQIASWVLTHRTDPE